MNYRHAYHAGNFADVVKHVLLTLLIDHLRKKETPFCVIDTHAGVGRYDLSGTEAGKTGEYADGIGRLLAAGPPPPLLASYTAALRAVNPDWPTLRFYPGSPRIARSLLRPSDRLALVELHPDDAQALKREFAHDGQVGVHVQDAYVALRALLPPKERRGLVLIDPPFEDRDEFRHIAKGLTDAVRRWRTGVFAVWYPIKAPDAVERFLGEVGGLGLPCLAAELFRFPPDDPERFNGTGLVVFNPPWKLDEALGDVLGWLKGSMACAGPARVRWLVGDV